MVKDDESTLRIPPSGEVATHRPKLDQPKLSVVLAGRNQSRALLRFGEFEAALDRPGVEFLYVDGGSDDDSVEIATRVGLTVHCAAKADDTIWKLWNRGWHAAHGELILFLELGKQFHPYFVARAIRTLGSEAIGAAVPLVPAGRRLGRAEVYGGIDGMATDAVGHHGVVCNRVISALDGFSDTEDPGLDLGRRILERGKAVRGIRIDDGRKPDSPGLLARLRRLLTGAPRSS